MLIFFALVLFSSFASALTVETKADWPAGEKLVKYNASQQLGALKFALNGQYLTSVAKEELTVFPSLAWQLSGGKLATSLSGRQLGEDRWQIWKASWDYARGNDSLSGSELRASIPDKKEAREWAWQYGRKTPWGNLGGQYFQQEAFAALWGLPDRSALSWQRLRAQELYAGGQHNLFRWGASQGYYQQWDRKERQQAGNRTQLWSEVATPLLQAGQMTVLGKGRWQDARYQKSDQVVFLGELNVSFKGSFLPPTSLYWKGKKVRGTSPFLFDREENIGEISLKNNYSGFLGSYELFTRYDYLARLWRESWVGYKPKSRGICTQFLRG